MRNIINFDTVEILEKLSTDELIFELKRRDQEEGIREIAFNYILGKVGYQHDQIKRIYDVLSNEVKRPSFNKASNNI